jgi:glycosyltransferase involved in cell wall biosynthesis
MLGAYPLQKDVVVGGVEAVVSVLASALAASPHIEHLTVLDFRLGLKSAKAQIISDKLTSCHYPAQTKLALPTRAWLDYQTARAFCKDYKPDIVHGQGIGYTGDIAIRLNPAAVVSVHGLIQVEARLRFSNSLLNRWRILLMERMAARVLNATRVTISTSAYDFHAVKGWVKGWHSLIFNPVDESFFKTNWMGVASQQILYAGTMSRRKNVMGLVRAFAEVHQQMPGAHLLLVGPIVDETYHQEVRAEAARLNLQTVVDFRGALEHAALVKTLEESRCLVLFSNEETSPTIIAQAITVGLPVVATRVGGIPELVEDGRGGFLVNAGDTSTLAQKIIAILRSEEMTRVMGAHNRSAAVNRCRPDKVAEQTIEAYRVALAEKP